MSYDLDLCDPVSGDVLQMDEPHQMRGGTYVFGGTCDMSFNITYNYDPFLYRELGEEGIRVLYGKTGLEAIPILEKAIAGLKDDVDPNYWNATEGNTKKALKALLTMSKIRPDGVWNGD